MVAMTALGISGTARAETYVPMGTLEASCTQDGVEVELDGQPWFTCPGTQKKDVSAGPHAVVGDRVDYLPVREKPFVPENGVAHVDISVVALDRPVVVEHRFPRWLPWSVGCGGIVLGAVGVLLVINAADRMNEYDQAVASQCAVTGCDLATMDQLGLTDIRESAELRNALGIVSMFAGAAVLVTGVVLYVTNKPVRQVPSVAIAPGGGGGMTATAGWRF
jgi:hypothetical protein